MINLSEKSHWYSFTFMHGNAWGSFYSGLSEKKVTVKVINSQKSNAKMPPDSVLVSFCYMGYMTRSEVIGDD